MPWVRIDDEFPDHPKVVGAGPLGIAMQVAALCYCNRHLTDGFVPRSTARRLIDLDELKVDPDDVIDALLRVGMWTRMDGGYQIHDYELYQFSRDEVEAQRLAEHDAKAAGGRARAAGAKRDKGRFVKDQVNTRITSSPPADEPAVSPAASHQPTSPIPKPVPPVATTGSPVTDASGSTTLVEQARPLAVIPGGFSDDPADILDVWDAWKQSTGHHRAEFSPIRRKAIVKALDKYPLQDVLDAVRGHVYDPWPERAQQNDITQLLHMGTQRKPKNILEPMRDLWRDGPPAVMGKHTSQTVAFARQMATMRPAKEVTADDVGRVDGDRALAQRQLSRPEG